METKSLENIMSKGTRVNKTKKEKKKKLKKRMKMISAYLVLFIFGVFISKLIVDSVTLDRLERKILKDTPNYIRKELEPFMR